MRFFNSLFLGLLDVAARQVGSAMEMKERGRVSKEESGLVQLTTTLDDTG